MTVSDSEPVAVPDTTLANSAPSEPSNRAVGRASSDSDDGPVPGDQAGPSRLPAVLPDGRFLRAFFEDAVAAAARLGHHADQARPAQRRRHPDVRRAGPSRRELPARLIRHGFKGRHLRADGGPGRGQKRGGKSVVERAVVRVVTPGTLTEDSLLDARATTSWRRSAGDGGRRRPRLARPFHRRNRAAAGRARRAAGRARRGSTRRSCCLPERLVEEPACSSCFGELEEPADAVARRRVSKRNRPKRAARALRRRNARRLRRLRPGRDRGRPERCSTTSS